MSEISTRLQHAGKPGPGLRAHESEIREQWPFRPEGRAVPSALAPPAYTPDLVLVCGARLQVMTVKRLGTAQEAMEERP